MEQSNIQSGISDVASTSLIRAQKVLVDKKRGCWPFHQEAGLAYFIVSNVYFILMGLYTLRLSNELYTSRASGT